MKLKLSSIAVFETNARLFRVETVRIFLLLPLIDSSVDLRASLTFMEGVFNKNNIILGGSQGVIYRILASILLQLI